MKILENNFIFTDHSGKKLKIMDGYSVAFEDEFGNINYYTTAQIYIDFENMETKIVSFRDFFQQDVSKIEFK